MKKVDISKMMVDNKYFFPVSKKITTGVYMVDVPKVTDTLHLFIKEQLIKAMFYGYKKCLDNMTDEGTELTNDNIKTYLKNNGYE